MFYQEACPAFILGGVKKLWERQGIKIEGVEERLKGAKKLFAPLKKSLSSQQNSSAPEAEQTREGGGRTDKLGGRKTYNI